MDSTPLHVLLRESRVLPVLTVHRLEQAVPLTAALAAGGIHTVEITLRTPCALDAIREVSRALPEITVGAGTLVDAAQAVQVRDAGARFAVSPGLTGRLAEAADQADLALLPGVATASEAMVARELGFTFLKLFPAGVLGGTALLRSFAGPLGDLLFCPTGGLNAETFEDYLKLKNVACVGGSWMVPSGAVERGEWSAVEDAARVAAAAAAAIAPPGRPEGAPRAPELEAHSR
ncbi:MAG: bifunctional 4-hydroxy-2-oxoglutarate aldolase/2-dehydro-3-deoxy-phosphogluconate aldolase [Acidobacteriota bacterium]